MSGRQFYLAKHLNFSYAEPLVVALVKYYWRTDRVRVLSRDDANVCGSLTTDGKHLPIIDLDFDHEYTPSSTPGHGHLYLNEPIGRLRWTLLMFALYHAKVIELGYFVWSIRRGQNFARLPDVKKTDEERRSKYCAKFIRDGSRPLKRVE